MTMTNNRTWLALLVAALAISSSSVTALSSSSTPKHHQLSSRRAWLAKTAVLATLLQEPAHAAVSAGQCVQGVGAGCADLAEGNAFIQALQEKSAANKERNEREARDAYYMKNYPDWFQAAGKTLIKKQSDGTFVAVDDAELQALKQANKLTLETAKSMGGRVVDYTQKPILVLKDL